MIGHQDGDVQAFDTRFRQLRSLLEQHHSTISPDILLEKLASLWADFPKRAPEELWMYLREKVRPLLTHEYRWSYSSKRFVIHAPLMVQWPQIKDALAHGHEWVSLITHLDITQVTFDDEDWRLLTRSPNLQNLKTLSMRQQVVNMDHLQHAHWPKLEALDIGINTIDMDALVTTRFWKQLIFLDICACNLGEDGIRTLSEHAPPRLTYLNLINNRLRDRAILPLIDASLPKLRALNLDLNGFGAEGVQHLCDWSAIQHITHLGLSGNPIQSEGMEILADTDAIENIKHLDLSYCKLETQGLEVLSSIEQLSTLRSLDLAANKIKRQGFSYLAKATHLNNLNTLTLSRNPVTNQGISQLIEEGRFDTLERLRLYNISMGIKGAQAIASASNMTRLISMDLSNNRIGSKGALALAKATHLKRLTHLNIEDNQIGPEGFQAMSHTTCLTGLTNLNANRNGIGDDGASALCQWPVEQWTYLGMDGNQISNQGALALAECASITATTTLSLSHNLIDDVGAIALANARPHRASPLKLYSNLISDEGLRALNNIQNIQADYWKL